MFRINKLEKSSRGAGESASANPELLVGSVPERLERFGAAALADRELVALVLGPGGRTAVDQGARRVCARWPDLSLLGGVPASVVARGGRISLARARRLLAALELGWRAQVPIPPSGLVVQRPEDLHPLLQREFQGLDRERFLALYLDTRHRLKGIETISIGTLNASLVHPREVFKGALDRSAAALVVAHNHPSGCAEPSGDDLELTSQLDDCGQLLGVALLDHLVVGSSRIVSIRENGWPLNRGQQK